MSEQDQGVAASPPLSGPTDLSRSASQPVGAIANAREPNGPDLWRKVLAVLPAGAIIAGGAVRDHFLGIEPKDIDVFLPSSEYENRPGFEPLGDDRRAEYEALPIIDVVTRGTIAGHQVDFVGVNPHCADFASGWSGEALVRTFDFGISRCWFDGAIHDTPEAKADRETRRVSVLITDRMHRATARFERFNERMGGAFTMSQAS